MALAREPRGFGFIQYMDPQDAADAKYQMDGQIFHGRELTVVFAEENRKKPTDMRARERRSRYDRRRSPPPRYSRSPRDSRSPPPRHVRTQSRSRDYGSPSPKQRQYSRSVSPQERKCSKERSYSPQGRERSYSRSPAPPNKSRSCSRSRSLSDASRSRSPPPENYKRESNGDRSPSPSH